MIFDNIDHPLKAILVNVPLPNVSDEEANESLNELERLVKTLGFNVVGNLTQRRPSHSGSTLLGQGKLKELAILTGGTGIVESNVPVKKSKAAEKFEVEEEEVEEEFSDLQEIDPEDHAEVVIFDCELTPSQLSNIQGAVGVEVLDRTGVIVEIFSRHAKTREAKLQVEIAKLKYLAPRIRAAGGGAGDRLSLSGETSLETDRRKIRDRIALLRRELEVVQSDQTLRRSIRSEQNSVALVGYTNAGKSSLMRALTGSEVLVEDKLFATLDTTVRSIHPPTNPKILLTDTVGFIKKLPHDLVASFKSTLDEAKNASLLLFVVDAADPTFRNQLAVTHEVLAEIGVEEVPSLLILNKADRLQKEEIKNLLQEYPGAIALSAKSPKDVSKLRETILHFFEEGMVDMEILIPYTVQGAIGEIRSSLRVVSERFEGEGVYLNVRGNSEDLERLKKKFGLNK